MSEPGHNSGGKQLLAFVQRLEFVEGEIKDLNDDKKEIYGEAQGMGWDRKILKKVLQIRRQDPDQRIEEEAILETYLRAIEEAEGKAQD